MIRQKIDFKLFADKSTFKSLVSRKVIFWNDVYHMCSALQLKCHQCHEYERHICTFFPFR